MQNVKPDHCAQTTNPCALSEHHRTGTNKKKGESAFFEREDNVPFDTK